MHLLKGKSLIITIAVFILLIFLHSLELFNPIEKSLFVVFAPVQKYFYSSGIKAMAFIEGVAEKRNQTEVELLKAQLRSLLVQNAKLKILEEENKLLKKELNFKQEYPYELVSASVMGSDALQNSSLMILRIDSNNYTGQDLQINMPVITQEGILIGKIAAIKQDQIFMLPITASRSAVAATLLNKDRTIGVAEGELNLAIKMRMIPQSENLKQGDLVVTSGLEAEMPKGLLLGTISKVAHDPQSPFDVAHITPLDTLKRLSKVLIIKKY
ncbi:rod shape-determining protein MreC [Patescibacteria group bacterium]|nr:rod shape-determining protein MreC [Patescibacteria group bacterium]